MNSVRRTVCLGIFATLALGMLPWTSSAEAGSPTGGHRYSRTLRVHGNQWQCIPLPLQKNVRYQVLIEHTKPEVYPSVYRPGFYDMKLQVKRYWLGHKKFDSGQIKRTSRISYSVQGVEHGDRVFKFCVYNALSHDKEFRITLIPIR